MPRAMVPVPTMVIYARELEALGYLHMAIQEPLGTGFGSTVKIVA